MAERRSNILPPPLKGSPMGLDRFAREQTSVRNDLAQPRLFLNCGIIKDADGSAFAECGRTKLLCSVVITDQQRIRSADASINVEVHAMSLNKEECDRSNLSNKDDHEKISQSSAGTDVKETNLDRDRRLTSFSSQSRFPSSFAQIESEIEAAVQSALLPSIILSRYSRRNINVTIELMEFDFIYSCMSLGITVASLALADAGIECFDIATGVCLAIFNDDIIMEPTQAEAQYSRLISVTGIMTREEKITFGVNQGFLTDKYHREAIQAATTRHMAVRKVLDKAAIRSVK